MKQFIFFILISCLAASLSFAKTTLSNNKKVLQTKASLQHSKATASTPIFLNAADYGVMPSSPDNYAALVSLLNTYPKADIYLPPGNYIVNNSPGYMTMNHYSGHLLCAANAVITLTNPANGGFYFLYGTGARLENLHITYSTIPTSRTNNHAIDCSNDTNIVVKHTWVNGSPGVGLLFNLTINPQVSGVVIQNTQADGCSFYSCQNAQIVNLNTHNTGDDAIAFFNAKTKTDFNGGSATNIIIANSKSRGIAVLGTSNVTVSNFTIDSTSAAGVYVATESLSRTPNNVHISNGVINHGGVVPGRGVTGNQYGLLDSFADSVYLNDIHILNSYSNGFEAVAPNGFLVANNISVFKSDTNNVYIKTIRSAQLSNIYSEYAGAYGFIANATNKTVLKI